MNENEIRWNEEARAKILTDSDNVLREAVLDLSAHQSDQTSDQVYADLFARLKDRFIDFEPGPDLRKYTDAIVGGQIAGAGGSGSSAGSAATSQTTAPDAAAPTNPDELQVNDG